MQSIDIFKIVNGKRLTCSVYDSVNVKDINDSVELDEWTEKHNVHFVNDDTLVDNYTKEAKYFIR